MSTDLPPFIYPDHPEPAIRPTATRPLPDWMKPILTPTVDDSVTVSKSELADMIADAVAKATEK